jgi:hypothetical protein
VVLLLQRARDKFQSKEEVGRPHMLYMTATPIPRTLAMIAQGDFALSAIEKPPAGRLPVRTHVVTYPDPGALGPNHLCWSVPLSSPSPSTQVTEEARERVYSEVVKEQLRTGGKAYVVCPRVGTTDPSADADLVSVYSHEEWVREQLPEFADQVAILHGQVGGSYTGDSCERTEGNSCLAEACVLCCDTWCLVDWFSSDEGGRQGGDAGGFRGGPHQGADRHHHRGGGHRRS